MMRTRFETQFITLIQQDESLLKQFVTLHPNCRGKAVELPYRGNTKMREYKDRFQKVEWDEIKFGKRTIRPRKFFNAIPLEEDDKIDLDTLTFSVADIMTEQRAAFARTMDEVILGVIEDQTTGLYRVRTQEDGVCGGVLGINYVGDDGSAVENLNPKNIIPVDYCNKGTKTPAGMLIDKIAHLCTIYRQNSVFKINRGEEVVVAISPLQHEEMVLWEQSMNKNYGFQSLTNGEVNQFLGVKFLITNMLPVDAEGNRMCVAWLKSRVKFGTWKDATFRVDPRNEYIGVREQVLIKAACGATRLDNENVFLMPCKESATAAA